MSNGVLYQHDHWFGKSGERSSGSTGMVGSGQESPSARSVLCRSSEGNTGVAECGRVIPVAIDAKKDRSNEIVSTSETSIRFKVCELRDVRMLRVLLEDLSKGRLSGIRWVEIRGYANGLEESPEVRDVL